MKIPLSLTEHQSSTDLQEAMLALSEQVTEAISAISERNLDQLEESLWQQQVLCATLQKRLTPSSLESVAPEAHNEVAEIATRLFEMNQIYAQLIHQAERTGRALYQLCSEYKSGAHVDAFTITRFLEA